MADNNEILLKFGLDQGSFKKLIQDFSNQLQSGIEKSLKDMNIGKEIFTVSPGQINNLVSSLKLAVSQARLGELVGQEITKGAQEGARNMAKVLRTESANIRGTQAATATQLTPAGALKDLTNFPATAREIAAALPNVQKRFDDLHKTLNVVNDDAQKLNAAAGKGKAPRELTQPLNISPGNINATSVALERLKQQLTAAGLKTKEAAQQTQDLSRQLDQIRKGYENVNLARNARVAAGGPGDHTEKEIEQLFRLQQRQKDLNTAIGGYSKQTAIANVNTKRSTDFMESFGFKVGILGFSLGILGGHLQRLTQNMAQFVIASAKAAEPLERIQNLITQLIEAGTIPADQKETIFSEINRLSDLPGSNLEAVTEGFRKLLVVTEDVGQSLKLVEQLTKATGRSGTGARGLGQLIFQLAQFAESKELIQRDIKTIKEQGGADISKIVEKAGGKEGIVSMGPEKFFQALITGLEKVPAPLEAAQDKLNKINNSLTRIRLNILEILKPGLDSLLGTFHKLEEVVTSLKVRFDALSPGSKATISSLILGVVALTAALSALLTVLAAVGIALAGGKHLLDSLGVATGSLSTRLKDLRLMLAGVATGGVNRLGTAVRETIAPMKAATTEVTMLASRSLASGKIFGQAGLEWGKILKSFFYGSEFIVGFGVKFRGFFAIMTAGLGGLADGLFAVVGLTSKLNIFLNVLLAVVTNAGRIRDTVGAGLTRLFEGLSNVVKKLSEASEKGTGLGRLVNFFIGLFETLMVVFDAFYGVVGTLLEAFLTGLGDVLDLVADLIDAFNADTWTEMFSKIVLAIETMFARSAISMHKFLLDLEISFVQAGVRLFKALPKGLQTALLGVGGVDQLSSLNESLIAQREGLDKLGVTVDKTTGKVVIYNKEQEKTKEKQKAAKQTAEEVAAAFALMAEQVRTLTLDLSKQQEEITSIGNAWEDAANKIKESRIQFNAQFDTTTATRDFSKLIKQDIDEAERQLGDFLQRNQDRATNAARAAALLSIQNATQSEPGAVNAINKVIGGAGKPDKKTGIRTDIGGLVDQMYPQTSAALTKLQSELVRVNALAKAGVTDFRSFENELGGANKTIQETANSLNLIRPGVFDDKQIKEVQGFVNEAVEASTKNIKELQSATIAASTAVESARQETIKNQDAYKEEFRLRKLALQAERDGLVLKQEIAGMNDLIIHKQELLQDAVDNDDLFEQKRILDEIHGTKALIVGKEEQLATLQNYENDQLQAAQILNEKTLKTSQLYADSQNTINALIRDTYKTQVAQYAAAIDSANQLIEKYKELNRLTGTPAEGLAAFNYADLDTIENAGNLEKFKRQTSEITKTIHSVVQVQMRGIWKDFSQGEVKSQFKGLLSQLYDLSNNAFEKAFDDLVLYYGRTSAQLVARLNATQTEIDRLTDEIKNNHALTDDDKVKLKKQLDAEVATREEIAHQISDVAKVEVGLNDLYEERNRIFAKSLENRIRGLRVLQQEIALQQQVLQAQIALEEARSKNQHLKATASPGGGMAALPGIIADQDKAREDALINQLRLLRLKHQAESADLEMQRAALDMELIRHAGEKESIDAINKKIAVNEELTRILNEQYDLERENAIAQAEQANTLAGHLDRLRQALDDVHSAGQQAADAIMGLFDAFASGKYVVADFADAIANGASLTKAFADLAVTAFAMFGKALADALVDSIANGENFIQSLGKFMGQMLIQLGSTLIQLGTAALALAALAVFFPIVVPPQFALGVPAALAAIGVGTGLVVAGALMGGGNAPAKVADKNASNSANAATGATGEGFDPNKDAKTAYQKALQAEILIDIRTDDTQIVKTVIKHVNGNGRLATLIGNRKLQFGY